MTGNYQLHTTTPTKLEVMKYVILIIYIIKKYVILTPSKILINKQNIL